LGFSTDTRKLRCSSNTDAATKSCSVACHVYYKLKDGWMDGEVFPKESKAKSV